jgi:TRAP-type mannitol/chloroaromatic compound transport system substrate-binding protein
MEDLGQMITKMSGGRIEVTTYPGAALVPNYGELDALQDGTIEAFHSGLSAFRGKLGDATYFGIGRPAGPTIYELLAWFYQGGGIELSREILAAKGYNNVYYVGPVDPRSAEGFGWFKKPITSLADFKGMKFRTAAIWGEVVSRKLGGAVTMIAASELYEAFKRGVIDGFEFSTPALDWDYKYQELGAYYHMPGVHQTNTLQALGVNKKAWDRLSPELQVIVSYAVQADNARLYRSNYLDGVAYQKMLDYGVKIVDLPRDVIKGIITASVGVYDEMSAKDPVFAKWYKSQEDFFKLYRECQNRITNWKVD